MGAALLRASTAWAQSANEHADELTRMARLLYPHNAIADDVYAEVIDDVLSAAADDSSMMETLSNAITALNAAQHGDWFEIGADDQIKAMKAVENEAFLQSSKGLGTHQVSRVIRAIRWLRRSWFRRHRLAAGGRVMANRYELSDSSVVVVIGSGAGGGTVSNELAQKGIDVVCLEAGSRMTLADIVNNPGVMNGRMGWLDKRVGAPTWLCKTVGGTTVRWSGITPRFQEHEFKPLSTYGKLDDTTAIDWPITLDELAPYYDKAEDRLGVSGTHGIPPSAETNEFKLLKAGGKKVGYKEITSTRAGINPVARDGRPGCRQIGFCWSGCAIGAKWSTLYSEIPKAEATDHFELRTRAMVVKINHDDSGKVTGVVYADENGDMHEQHAARDDIDDGDHAWSGEFPSWDATVRAYFR
jgi:hypothetical protein